MLEIRQLKKMYGRTAAVDGLDMKIGRASCRERVSA